MKLFDPLLTIAAEQIFDLEKARIAAQNRYRALTRSEADADGEVRGYGLDAESVEVRRLAALIDGLTALEHQADLNLCRLMRAHPLGAWQKRTIGVGEKQLARLLGVIGDPYWNARDDRPRTVSQLWAYCGLHVLPAGGHSALDAQSPLAAGRDSLLGSQTFPDIHMTCAAEDQPPADQASSELQSALVGGVQHRASGHRTSDIQAATAAGPAPTSPARVTSSSNDVAPGTAAAPDTDQGCGDTHGSTVGVAARRRKGQRANWSTAAKTRVYLIAESCLKQTGTAGAIEDADTISVPRRPSPYRLVYDTGRAKYADAVHTADCPQCKAKAGELLTLGHQHARAMRLASKAILKDLWAEARRLHDGETLS
jgi:hypothetical protein